MATHAWSRWHLRSPNLVRRLSAYVFATLVLLSVTTSMSADSRPKRTNETLRKMGVDLFALADELGTCIVRLIGYADEVKHVRNRNDLAQIAILLQQIAAEKAALATRVESPLLWGRRRPGHPTYEGSEIKNIIDALNKINELGRKLQPDWKMANFQLTGYMEAVIREKFVLIDSVSVMVQKGDSYEGKTIPITLHVAIVNNGQPMYMTEASELARFLRDEASRFTDLANQVSAAYSRLK